MRYQRLFERLLMSHSNEHLEYALERAKFEFVWITGVEWDECLKILGANGLTFQTSPHLSSSDKQEEQGAS
jgi:hypothetical protein